MMMKKDAFTEKLSLWLDNELSPTEVVELKAHLDSCPACRQAYQAMQRVDNLLRLAATTIAAPSPGFNQQFETRLAGYRPGRPWQIWLAIGGLLTGTLLFGGAVAVVGGLAVVNLSGTGLEADWFYQWLAAGIESVTNLRVLINLGGLFLKATFITMGQPLFWLCVLMAISMAWLWVRVMQTVSRRATPTVEFVL